MPYCKCYAEAEGHPRMLILEMASWDCKSLEGKFRHRYEEDIRVVCVEE